MSTTLTSMTLNLVDHLLHSARNLHEHGQHQAAAKVLTRLTALGDVPRDIAQEAHVRLAEIHLHHDRPKQARRHLTVALAHDPDCPHYHYLLAVAVEDDPNGDPKRAAVHYRRALRLDPDHADYQCDYGLYAIRNGKTRAGVTALRRAARLAPDEPAILSRVVDGLRQAGRAGEAKQLLRAALFRHPRDRRFRDLWIRHQFDVLHAAQNQANDRYATVGDEPVILRFPGPKRRLRQHGTKTLRIDGPEEPRGPKTLPFHVIRKKDA
ncbi:MAG: tetratricopeptide repeat protein [Gemmataceae bacterium]|nr:tetratricopeptide repeat protein [Gemmataceae bacterium]